MGYEDENSIGIKMDYIRSMQFGGSMIWAIDLDDFNGVCGGRRNPLLQIIKEKLHDYMVTVPDPSKLTTTARPGQNWGTSTIKAPSNIFHPKPFPGLPRPKPGIPNPFPGLPRPTPGIPRPLPGIPRPTPGIPNPIPGIPNPTPWIPKPGIVNPTPWIPYPTPGISKPTPEVPKPTPAVPKPTPAVPKPTPAVPKPTPAVPKPTSEAPDEILEDITMTTESPETSSMPAVSGNKCSNPETQFIAHPDCNKYYWCVHGILYEQMCPDNLVWDTKLNRCEWNTEQKTKC